MSVNFLSTAASEQSITRTTNVPQASGCTVAFHVQIPAYTDWSEPFLSANTIGGFYFGFESDAAGEFYCIRKNNVPNFAQQNLWTDGYTGWSYVALVLDGTNINIYFQREGGSWTSVGTITLGTLGTLDTISFGSAPFFAPYVNDACRLREMRVWSSQLTQTQLQAERISASPVITSNLLWYNGATAAATVNVDGSPVAQNFTIGGTPTDSSSEPTAMGGGATAIAPEPQQPLPIRRRSPLVEGWLPLPAVAAAAIVGSFGFSESPAPRKIQATRDQSTAPLPKLIRPGWGLEASPVPRRSKSPVVDAWEPLPAVVLGPTKPTGYESAPQPLPKAPRAPRVDAWEPLAKLILPGWGFDASPLNRAVRSPIVDSWSPLRSVATTTPASWGFDATPLPVYRRPQFDGNSAPLAALITQAQVNGWGFSQGQSYQLLQLRPDDWAPLPGVATALPNTAVDCQAPLPRKVARVVPEGWQPLGLVAVTAPAAGAFNQAPDPRWLRKIQPEAWAPLASLPGAPIEPQSQPVTQPRLARALVNDWAPIPLLGPALPTLVEPQSPTNRQLVRASVGDWEPLGQITAPAFPTLVEPAAPINRGIPRATVGEWNPLGQLTSPATPAHFESAYPVNRPSPRANVGDWTPLGQLTAPAAPAHFETASPVNRQSLRANVGEWDPLGQLTAPAFATLVPCQDPLNRATLRATVPDWSPVASLGQPPLALQVESGALLKRTLGSPRPDNWEPLPTLQAIAPSAFGYECASPVNPRPKAQQPDAWQPLGTVVLAPTVPVGYECSSFLPRKVRSPVVDAWQPLGAVAVAAQNTPSVDCQSPEPRKLRAIRPDAWEPLPGGASGPAVDFATTALRPQRRAPAEAWAPVASLGQPLFSLGPECQAPDAKRLSRIVAESWQPIASLPVSIAVECQPTPQRVRRSLVIDSWMPLPALPVSLLAVAFSSELQRAKLSVAAVPAWGPLPALIPPPPVIPWVDFFSPIPRFVVSRTPLGDGGSAGWMGGIVAPVIVGPVVATSYSESATPTSLIVDAATPTSTIT